MKRQKKLLGIMFGLTAAACLYGCGAKTDKVEETTKAAETETKTPESEVMAEVPEGDVTILYTNDVHTYIHNQVAVKDEKGEYTGEVVDLLTYGKVAALKQNLQAEGQEVILVDAGDHVQGTAYGGMDEGASVLGIMEAAGYDLATLGNHEFDYGMFRTLQIIDESAFPYLSCNFYSLPDQTPVLPASQIVETDGLKIAFIGISTPESMTKSTPVYFQDEQGNFIYGFAAGDDGQELYDAVQKAIDEVRDHVNYVIGLGHLGISASSVPYRSIDVIGHIHGLDALIDGHSHDQLASEMIEDKDGHQVLLTQTGSYLNAIGMMKIHDGVISTELITEYEDSDETVDAMTTAWVDTIEAQLGETIAYADSRLAAYEVEGDMNTRLVRRMETGLGDLAADAIYYHFNEAEQLDCDMAIVGGGNVRADILEGSFSYKSVKDVHPFGNVICMLETSGENVREMLEWSVRALGLSDEMGNPAEIGGFLQVAGLRFKVSTEIDSSIQSDENENYGGAPEGDYRVHDIEVYNRETGSYEALDLKGSYTIAGPNYNLRNSGDGYTMLADSLLIKDYVGEDYLIFSDYVKAFEKDSEGLAHVSSQGSPLAAYEGYLLDYENVHGSGRIVFD